VLDFLTRCRRPYGSARGAISDGRPYRDSETLLAIPLGLLAEQQKVQPSGVGVKVKAGVDRFNDIRKLPGGDQLSRMTGVSHANQT
jgi:hypothetical protein